MKSEKKSNAKRLSKKELLKNQKTKSR